ncbi:unnamed protein product [Polarella glacialis]|uniref:Uncharacterized protein n=1 Tax=Polarella glacialis TaxID=89957 RepID=A0A813LSY8_POLGL|nr:unnamed protein product [Polarella glacialis]
MRAVRTAIRITARTLGTSQIISMIIYHPGSGVPGSGAQGALGGDWVEEYSSQQQHQSTTTTTTTRATTTTRTTTTTTRTTHQFRGWLRGSPWSRPVDNKQLTHTSN